MAIGAGIHPRHLDGALAALGRLLKGDGHSRLYVLASAGGVGVSLTTASKASAEEGAEYIAEIVEAEACTVEAACSARAEVRVYARMTVLVISRPLVAVGEHLVSLVDLLEFSLRLGVAGVEVRVILLRLFSVCFFYFVLGCALLDSEHFIIITFILCQRYFSLGNQACSPRFRFLLFYKSPSRPRRHYNDGDSPI